MSGLPFACPAGIKLGLTALQETGSACHAPLRRAGSLPCVALHLINKLLDPKGNHVNKSELTDAVAAAADLPKAGAGRAVDAVLDAITKALASGEQVSLVGFGTFAVKERAARTGRNPKTGAAIEIAASRQASFKPGKALKDAL